MRSDAVRMHRTQDHRGTAERLRRRKKFLSSVKGVSHLSRRAKRRLYCKLQLWMWRKRREKCHLRLFRTPKKAYGVRSDPCVDLKGQAQGSKSHHSAAVVSSLKCVAEASVDTRRRQKCPQRPHESVVLSKVQTAVAEIAPLRRPSVERLSDAADASKCAAVKAALRCQHATVTTVTATDETLASRKSAPAQISLQTLTDSIHDFLDEFYQTYGSFIPFHKSDIFRHLKKKFNIDVHDRINMIVSEVNLYKSVIVHTPLTSFRVVYKKHTLTLEDLSTLADQNWLNDQVMNMYGELIMDSSQHQVHFLNSFFHRQLMTKGYDGVKRWTKQVDLFSKTLLLVPVHLEVHWCVVTADLVRKKICLYDSQGNALQKVARNILKYLMAEAQDKRRTSFSNGWTVSFDERIPQQTNENDCGVFVLEYCRCLALDKPLRFSQDDIPKIRRRIYKELCERRLYAE